MDGLLKAVTGDNGDLAGPFHLKEGALVRNRKRAGKRHDRIECSRDGWHWETFRVRRDELLIGDVTEIRAVQRAVHTVPNPPADAKHFVWVWTPRQQLSGDEWVPYIYSVGKRPETYQDPFFVPTRWVSVIAFDDALHFVGVFKPRYPDWGWANDWRATWLQESIDDARSAVAKRFQTV